MNHQWDVSGTFEMNHDGSLTIRKRETVSLTGDQIVSPQKFHKGDLVHVAKDLGEMMRHFTADIDAIVLGSYKDQYGSDNTQSYSLHLKGEGHCSWYYENQLELIEAGRIDLLEQWEAEAAAFVKQNSDLDWIFENGPAVADKPSGASLQALYSALGGGSLWGSNGEGINYYENSRWVWSVATPFLTNRDKAGFLALKNPTEPKP